MAHEPKHELVQLLMREAFDPVMHAKPAGRSEHERAALEHVQEATRKEIERYRNYGSAEEVFTNFRRDLTSSAAKKVHAELAKLQLPTLEDVREAFEHRAEQLGIRPGK